MLLLELITDTLAVTACGVSAAQTLGFRSLGWMACVFVALLAWQFKRLRWYGLTLLWCPGMIGFLATQADPLTRAWGAILGMLGFYALWCVLQARDEDSHSGWWAAALLVIWQPSSLALLGITFLAAQATTRWRSQLAPARGAARHSSPSRWLGVAALAGTVFVLSLLLPSPAPWRVQDILLPSLDLNVPKAGFSSLQTDLSPRVAAAQGLNFDPRPILVGILALGALMFLQTRFQRMRGQVSISEIKTKKKPKAKFDLVFVFVIASVLVMMLIAWTIRTFSSRTIPVHLPTAPNWVSAGLVLIFVLGITASLWFWVRAYLAKRALKPLEIITFPGKKRGALELPENRVRAAYALWLRLLFDLELPRETSETPFEFSRRVSVHHPTLREATRVLTEAYERVRYGSSLLESDALKAEEALEDWRSSVQPNQTDGRATSLTLEKPASLLD